MQDRYGEGPVVAVHLTQSLRDPLRRRDSFQTRGKPSVGLCHNGLAHLSADQTAPRQRTQGGKVDQARAEVGGARRRVPPAAVRIGVGNQPRCSVGRQTVVGLVLTCQRDSGKRGRERTRCQLAAPYAGIRITQVHQARQQCFTKLYAGIHGDASYRSRSIAQSGLPPAR